MNKLHFACLKSSIVTFWAFSLLFITSQAGAAPIWPEQTGSTTSVTDLPQVDSNEAVGGGQLRFRRQQPGQSSSADWLAAPLLDSQVSISVSGLIARVKLTQNFENITGEWMEGLYLFPLPEMSAVDSLTMQIGERLIVGEIKEKQVAKKIYQQAKEAGQKTALVEQHRPNVFSSQVANIAPYETIRVTIEYQQKVDYQASRGFSLRFPMTMTPRYTPRTMVIESFDDLSAGLSFQPSFSKQHFLAQEQPAITGNRVHLAVNLDAGLPLTGITSSSHQLRFNQLSETEYQITTAQPDVFADRDFILHWASKPEFEPRAAIFTEEFNNDRYLSIMLMPPQPELALPDQTVTPIPREVIFVVDTSGSMAGDSIQQAKNALVFGLDTLEPVDRFNLIEFNSTSRSLFPSSRPANPQNRAVARNFILGLVADGGTEMERPMLQALTDLSNSDAAGGHWVRQVVFLTDGAVSNESALFSIIQQNLGQSRLFPIGIGSAPNEFFMKRAAMYGKGQALFINDLSRTEQQVKELFQKISQPMLSHLQFSWPQDSQVEMWPNQIPDLMAGEPLWIQAKLSETKTTQTPNPVVQVTGLIGDQIWQAELPTNQGKSRPGIAKLWAREKIAALMNQAHHGRLGEAEQQLATQTALQHHLVSRFTSLIAVDKTPARSAEVLHSLGVPQNSPHGSTAHQLHYPKTALPVILPLSWGLAGLLGSIAGLIWLRKTRPGVSL